MTINKNDLKVLHVDDVQQAEWEGYHNGEYKYLAIDHYSNSEDEYFIFKKEPIREGSLWSSSDITESDFLEVEYTGKETLSCDTVYQITPNGLCAPVEEPKPTAISTYTTTTTTYSSTLGGNNVILDVYAGGTQSPSLMIEESGYDSCTSEALEVLEWMLNKYKEELKKYKEGEE